MKITLFLPTRNEIIGARAIFPKIDLAAVDEVLVVDGDSTDGTREYFESQPVRVVRQSSSGIGGAYWECLAHATGDAIIAFSLDGNSLPELIPELAAKMREGYDMVIASRYLAGAGSEDDDWVTSFGNKMFTRLVNGLFDARYTDSLVMLRAFRKDLASELGMEPFTIPVFEYLLCIRCAKMGRRVAEIPGFEPKRIGGKRKMRPLYNGSMLLLCLWREWIGRALDGRSDEA